MNPTEAITIGSVCSGIEAASVALGPLGFVPAWLSEIDPFASAVLAHHYPAIPNLGDMTAIARRVLAGEVAAPDVLCGGTPCQAFSVAGLRNSLADARGNLTLKFVELADAIDHVRLARGKPAAGILWENVPGVLSTPDNAFGCFLAGLAGADGVLEPPEQRPAEGKSSRYWSWSKKLQKHIASWANAGAVYGPARSVAWRTMDAQYFGLAQRRRRVFVVASARNGFDPAAVLFEWDGMRRDTAPSRQEGESAAATITAGARKCDHAGSVAGQLIPHADVAGTITGGARRRGGYSHDDVPLAYGGNNQRGAIDVATARNACASASGRLDFDTETFLVQPAHTLRGEGFDASEGGTGRGTPLVPVAYATKLHNTTSNQAGKFYENYTAALDANSPPPAIVFDTTQITGAANYSSPKPGDPCHPLAAGAHAPTIAFPARMSATQHASTENLSPALGATNPTECERLQGFPDGYTAIPWRGKPADQCPDGPRYKALGNSWPVPVVRWIGHRLARALRSPA